MSFENLKEKWLHLDLDLLNIKNSKIGVLLGEKIMGALLSTRDSNYH